MGEFLLLGVDGGGSHCRARLATAAGKTIGEGIAGPANIRMELEESFAAVFASAMQCLTTAGLNKEDGARIIACFTLAGATGPAELAAARRYKHPFAKEIIVSDVHAACIGAHGGRDGGVLAVGTGTIGWAERAGQHDRVGGWGFPLSDEGSGAWLGAEALRRVLWAHDGRIPWSPALHELSEQFKGDPHAIVRFVTHARPKDFARFAPIVVAHAAQTDPAAVELMRLAASHIEALLARLVALGSHCVALVGGLSAAITPWLSAAARAHLVAPEADALAGALQLARKLLIQSTAVADLAHG